MFGAERDRSSALPFKQLIVGFNSHLRHHYYVDMIRCGKAPFLECSSIGDRRFSAFHARPSSLGGRSIEEAYQAFKIFEDGSTGLTWQKAKGRYAVNQVECLEAYKQWWREWVEEQDLLPVLRAASGLSDAFGQIGRTCQAAVLWEIRNTSSGLVA